MSSPAHLTLSGNTLLAALPQATLAGLQFSHVALPQGQVCFEAGEQIDRVYFPTGGLISLVISTEKGDLIEAGMVGREGAAGVQSALGQRFSFPCAVVQIPGPSYVVSAEALKRAVAASEQAKAIVQQYIGILWAEAQQVAACNAAHEATARLARWLLRGKDTRGEDRQAARVAASKLIGPGCDVRFW
jgi:CRP-like cAMP-binding protein